MDSTETSFSWTKMKIHRLVIIERVRDGKHIAAVEDTTGTADALQGLDDSDLNITTRLIDGDIVRLETISAGIRTRITLTPSHAINRQGLLRRKKELASASAPPHHVGLQEDARA
jgi:hypothetical protein